MEFGPQEAVELIDPGAVMQHEDTDTLSVFWVQSNSGLHYPQDYTEEAAWESAIQYLMNLLSEDK